MQATLGAALAWTGRSRQGLAVLDRALATSRGDLTGRVLMRRARASGIWAASTRPRGPEPRPAVPPPGGRHGMGGTIADRAGLCLSRARSPRRAAADFARAEELFAANGQDLEYAKARHNLGLAALTRGDLPQALTYFDEAGRRYEALGENVPELAVDRCPTLLAAGLAEEAAQETDTALSRIPPGGGIAYRNAELLFAAATAALAAGHPADARQRARQARRLFQAQRSAPLGGARQPRSRRGQVRRGRAFRRACSATPSRSPPGSRRPGPARRCRRTCWPGASP